MATATKKTSSKKRTKKAARKVSAAKGSKAATKPAAKAKSKAQCQAKPPTANGVKAEASQGRLAKVSTKAKATEPERSSPAMAVVDRDVLEFIAAIDDFKQANGRPFPSWSEVLLVVRQLGYTRK